LNSGESAECSAIDAKTAKPGAIGEPKFCSDIADRAAEFAARQCAEALAAIDPDEFEWRALALAPRLGDRSAAGRP
jgi:hypothetical protein